MRIPFNNTYAQLPGRFYFKQEASKVPAPEVIRINTSLAKELSLEYGRVSTASVGAIQRRLLTLEQQGAEHFFGECLGHEVIIAWGDRMWD